MESTLFVALKRVFASISLRKSLGVSGATSVVHAAELFGILTVAGTSEVKTTLTVASTTNFGSSLTVSDSADFAGVRVEGFQQGHIKFKPFRSRSCHTVLSHGPVTAK
jgi:hypothetical protein